MERDNNPLILKFGQVDANGKDIFLREVESAVRNGRPLMVEDVEEHIDPAIDPILLK
jgi:hypothetical protein